MANLCSMGNDNPRMKPNKFLKKLVFEQQIVAEWERTAQELNRIKISLCLS